MALKEETELTLSYISKVKGVINDSLAQGLLIWFTSVVFPTKGYMQRDFPTTITLSPLQCPRFTLLSGLVVVLGQARRRQTLSKGLDSRA